MAAHHMQQSDDPGLSLALAMVVSSTVPLLLLDGELKIVAASASFCRAFDLAPEAVAGRRLFELGDGEWGGPRLRSLIDATASGDAEIEAYEMDLKPAGRAAQRLVLNVKRLAYGTHDRFRLLISATDVTQARLREREAEELARQNETLMQEVRHRVANSLQIIASVLMQNARRTQSEETRAHLRDAHQRVLSIAELQQQLAASTMGTVRIRAYLTKLCETIAASMIVDPKALVLEVVAADVVVDAGVSVSLGLIVTELVINALKHAFPDRASGRIVVDFQAEGAMWTLCVRDDGVGMPPKPDKATAGLGTSIVEALARQLKARVAVEPMHPGLKVSVISDTDEASLVGGRAGSETAV